MVTEAIKSNNINSSYHHPVKSEVVLPMAPVFEAQTKKPYVIVAIPAYNEEIAIGSVILRSLKHANKVLVINDGSKDKTSEIAKLAGAEVIEHNTNKGKGVAIKDAFIYAKKENADILVLIDGDGQHNPDEIPLLLAPIINGEANIVNGSRFVNGNGHNVPKYRRLGQDVLSIATNIGTKLHITDTQNGFRAFSKKSFNSFSFSENGMAIESEMLMDAAGAGLKITEVPIDVRYDLEGSTYDPLSHGFSVLGKVIGLISQRRPLLFFCIPGVILFAIGSILGILVLQTFNATGVISIIYTGSCALFILMGTFSIFTGLILAAIQSVKTN
jgi:glycosyltransferase involved in cell wall biosynthesis